jgi:hypothetical protein
MEFPGIDVESSARVSHDLSTTNRGALLPSERGTIIGRHNPAHDAGGPTGSSCRSPRNSVMHPDTYVFGATGDVGVNDPDCWDCEE